MSIRTISQALSYCLILLGTTLSGCNNSSSGDLEKQENLLPTQTFFQLLETNQTGVDFINEVHDGPEFNILTYRNFYNGGGVSIGDINNDGLPDLYFTANQSGNKLYLNKGNFQFEEITEKAGVAGKRAWSTGTTMADVNGDGWLDIYVSNSGDIAGANKENELFINNGDLTFREEAKKYGLNNGGYSTQACFFDYDLDGDLDCYLLNNSFKDPSKIELYKSMRDVPDELSGDKLYRNDGATFTDVTLDAGIYSSAIGFGLGAAIGDLNGDHLPDIYVSNDFWERDYLYLNQGDGTFSEELKDRIDFCSISSMGGDIADINNDGHPEIFSTDMLAADNYRLKAMSRFDPYHLEDRKYRANYHYQIAQNCLHLNDGNANFQEIGMLSEVAATDWSWGALIFDFENDGNKDIFVSNGIQKDLMYMDFRDFLADNDVHRKIAQKSEADYLSMVNEMPSNPLPNFAFANTGNLQFKNKTQQLGLGQPSFSNGAAYGDLDLDGDLDLVINNVNMPCFIYKNEAEKMQNHYLKIQFEGSAKNPFGIGAQVDILVKDKQQTHQNFNSRGFQSSIEPQLILGLGQAATIDELTVTWPDKKTQKLTNVATDQTLLLKYTEATAGNKKNSPTHKPLFTQTENILKGDSRHRENIYNDFDHETLLLKMLSTESPRIVKGDVNNDQREDFIVLGAKNDEDKLFIQTDAGDFQRKPSTAFRGTKMFESSCGAFFDYDKDGDLDLMLGAGGNEYQTGGKYFILRYYRNDGKGNFTVDNKDIPQLVGNFSCIEPTDIDNDGDTDLFLGGRTVPGNYGLPPRSFLLINDNGNWIDVTPSSLAGMGMVTDAIWADTDGDNDSDLVVVGDWMSVQVFRNEQGTLGSPTILPNSKGWWNRIEADDLDKDGDIDFVLGNVGLNTKFKASPNRPLSMFVADFDQNDKSEFIINWYPPLDNKPYPFASKPDLIHQLPALRKSILKYETYAQQTYETLFSQEIRQNALSYEAEYLQSAIAWNQGTQFSLEALPIAAQVAPVYGIAIGDMNDDGHKDIWLGGNFYALQPQVGRFDASRGVFLAGNSGKQFEYIPPKESGIYVEGEVRDATVISTGASQVLLISRNNEEVLAFKKNH